MKRRTFLQMGVTGMASMSAIKRVRGSSAQTGVRELVVHTVHEALVHSTPLSIYSGLKSTPVDEPLLIQTTKDTPTIEVWDDWSDYDLRQAFGGFVVGTVEEPLGTYLIFDTPDIAHGVLMPIIDEVELGYLDVGGMRASLMDDGGNGFGVLRLWNVLITGTGETSSETQDVMFGMVKHLGRAIGAIDPV